MTPDPCPIALKFKAYIHLYIFHWKQIITKFFVVVELLNTNNYTKITMKIKNSLRNI